MEQKIIRVGDIQISNELPFLAAIVMILAVTTEFGR